MRHKFLVVPVKKWLKWVHIYGSYRKNKTGVPFFWNTRYSGGKQGRIKGGAKGAAATGPAISRGPHFGEVQKIIFKNLKT